MQITKDQIDILEKFSCERLSHNQENKNLIKNFKNEKGELLVNYLNQYAWEEDEKGITAYYLVKDPNNQILMFFSLKCGSLFNILLDEMALQQKINLLLKKIHTINKEKDNYEKLLAIQLLEQFRTGQNISISEIEQMLKDRYRYTKDILKDVNFDKEKEVNKQIIRVNCTYPGIELMHFCTNDNAKDFWHKCSIKRPMGEVLFWKFIVPIVFKVQNQIGCQYIFLFASDTSQDETLINYYNISLKFEQPDNIGTSKPRYDFCCKFMCQEISKLKENHQEYFNNFNPDDEDIIA